MSAIKEKAEQLLAARLRVVDDLETSTGGLVAAQQHVRAAEAARAAAWTAAVSAGWTAQELRKLGFTAPTNRRGGRPKTARKTSTFQEASA